MKYLSIVRRISIAVTFCIVAQGLPPRENLDNLVDVEDQQQFSDTPSFSNVCNHVEGKQVVWDESCFEGALGCGAGGQQMNCRFCGFSLYPACSGRNHQPDIGIAENDTTINVIEGDMVINKSEAQFYHEFGLSNDVINEMLRNSADQNSEVFQNAIRSRTSLWDNAILPFTISLSFNDVERATILTAMATLEQYTCIRFVQRYYETTYLNIIRGAGCFSYVGKSKGPQNLSLGYGCIWTGTIMHELMHAIGFYHEQSRADRDVYVDIFWDNILKGSSGNFQKYTLQMIDHLGQAYDYDSIMHYASTAFGRNGLVTIQPKLKGYTLVHSSKKTYPSQTDADKINILYNCPTRPTVPRNVIPTDPPTHAPYTTRPPVPGCEDHNEYCAAWARSNLCESNTLFMYNACPFSCNQCSSHGGNACKDNDADCPSMALRGDCSSSVEYMRVVCARSCRYC